MFKFKYGNYKNVSLVSYAEFWICSEIFFIFFHHLPMHYFLLKQKVMPRDKNDLRNEILYYVRNVFS